MLRCAVTVKLAATGVWGVVVVVVGGSVVVVVVDGVVTGATVTGLPTSVLPGPELPPPPGPEVAPDTGRVVGDVVVDVACGTVTVAAVAVPSAGAPPVADSVAGTAVLESPPFLDALSDFDPPFVSSSAATNLVAAPDATFAAGVITTCIGAETAGTRLAAATPAAITAVRAGASAPVTDARTSSGSAASHATGPITRRNSPTEIARNARTMCGSNCEPALSVSSTRACAAGNGFLYERAAVMTSNASATDDDAARERDVHPGDPVGVALPVEALVVLTRGEHPLAQPGREAADPAVAVRRVPAHVFPLFGREPALLVQDGGRHVELADVVQQRGPVQLRGALFVEAELLSDQVGVGAYPFAVAAGHPVVPADRADECDDGLGGLLRGAELLLGRRVGDGTFERASRPGLERERES